MENRNVSLAMDMSRMFDLKQENTSKVADFLQPVKEIAPRINIARHATAGSTIYTTPSDKDFFLSALHLVTGHAVADTGTASSVTAVIDGSTRTLISHVAVSGESSYLSSSLSIPPQGIKIDRNTAITLSGPNFTIIRSHLLGYTQETTRGV